jgi:hypothetical protein
MLDVVDSVIDHLNFFFQNGGSLHYLVVFIHLFLELFQAVLRQLLAGHHTEGGTDDGSRAGEQGDEDIVVDRGSPPRGNRPHRGRAWRLSGGRAFLKAEEPVRRNAQCLRQPAKGGGAGLVVPSLVVAEHFCGNAGFLRQHFLSNFFFAPDLFDSFA